MNMEITIGIIIGFTIGFIAGYGWCYKNIIKRRGE